MTYHLVIVHFTLKETGAHLHNMARLIKEFDAFGVNYRSKQYSAVYGLELMETPGDMDPFQVFTGTEVEHNGQWVPLSDRYTIDVHVVDLAGILSGFSVLRAVMGIVSIHNFGFLVDWRGVKVPNRFLDDAASVATANARPLVAQLQAYGSASLKELEEYYSLEDAFKLFDINVAKGVNEALANEAAARASGR